MIDTSMTDYPEFGPIKNEKATSTIGWSSETELADEDWARVRTALEEAIKQKCYVFYGVYEPIATAQRSAR